MEIFKLFESAMANIQPGHINIKDLRRDQLLDHYDEATKALQTLIRAKENEIAYRKDLSVMLDQSKTVFDKKLAQAKQDYQVAKRLAPETLDLKNAKKPEYLSAGSTTPPLPPVAQQPLANPANTFMNSSTTMTMSGDLNQTVAPGVIDTTASSIQYQTPNQLLNKSSDLDFPMPAENNENRSSLDRRLSEFLKTFPNLTQPGLVAAATNDPTNIPLPGYYTQHPPPPPPPQAIPVAPPLMAMMRFPPPNLLPINTNDHVNRSRYSSSSSSSQSSNRSSNRRR